MPQYYIGTSGWHYRHWQEKFYPAGLPKTRWLEYYARHFPTVELNNSFYCLPSEKAFLAWRESSPPGFIYAVKVSRFITHIKKLRNIEQPLRNFMDRARLLEGKLGPLLYQLPPQMPRNNAILEDFLSILPTEQSWLSKKDSPQGRSPCGFPEKSAIFQGAKGEGDKGGEVVRQPLKHAFEFRHSSWLDEEMYKLLRRHNAGFCIYDLPGFTTPLAATADFAYIRFHGSAGLYSSCYTEEELEKWAGIIAPLACGLKAVYIYFNNDAQGYAVKNALRLREKLSR